jgi:FkbM family methyltransferase
MVNLSRIPNQTLLGRVLRAPLHLIPRTAVFPILQGPLRGKKWIVGSSDHGCWLGTFEYEKQRVFQVTIKAGDVVYDIGANVGFYTLLSSILVGTEGRVYAFEPLRNNLRDLHKHLEMNRVSNCTVIEGAVSSEQGEGRFDPSRNRSQGRLSETGTVVVRKVSLDSLLRQRTISPPSLMKIDIEGGEVECLRGGIELIRSYRPTIFLATHGSEVRASCLELLAEFDYKVRSLDSQPILCSNELVVTPLRR